MISRLTSKGIYYTVEKIKVEVYRIIIVSDLIKGIEELDIIDNSK